MDTITARTLIDSTITFRSRDVASYEINADTGECRVWLNSRNSSILVEPTEELLAQLHAAVSEP